MIIYNYVFKIENNIFNKQFIVILITQTSKIVFSISPNYFFPDTIETALASLIAD